MSGLPSLGLMQSAFVADCRSPRALILSQLAVVRKIGPMAVYRFYALTSVKLSGLCHVEDVGFLCMQHCLSLLALDLRSMSALQTVGIQAFMDCRSLTSSANVSGLHHVRELPCSGLSTVDLSSLPALQSIGQNVLGNCYALQSADFSGLHRLEEVGTGFMTNSSVRAAVLSARSSQGVQVNTGSRAKCCD
jgi:hypothetical protein